MLSFGSPQELRTAIIRVEPGFIDLSKLRDVDSLLERIIRSKVDPSSAIQSLHAIQNTAPNWGIWGSLVGFSFAGAAASRFFGGGIHEILIAMITGLIVGFAMLFPLRHPERAPLADLIAAFIATFFAWSMTIFFPSLQPGVVVLASLVVLLPGLTTTLAINELATRNLASGSARLMQALMGFVSLAIGSLIGEKFASFLPISETGIANPLPPWTLIPALILSGVALSILFAAKAKDIFWIILVGSLGFICARSGGEHLGPVLGVAIGAFAVGTAGNFYRRFVDAPSATLIVPGIMILVPGGLGMHSIEGLFDTTKTANAGLLLAVVTIAGGLVVGLLVANLIFPSRKLI
jgi:uncharacterized membrane protein YjjP (DUF1212 family)